MKRNRFTVSVEPNGALDERSAAALLVNLEVVKVSLYHVCRGFYSNVSFETAYRAAYQLVFGGWGQQLYDLVCKCFRDMARVVVRGEYERRVDMLCNIVLYLAKTYIATKNLDHLLDVAKSEYLRPVAARWRRVAQLVVPVSDCVRRRRLRLAFDEVRFAYPHGSGLAGLRADFERGATALAAM